MVLRVDNLTNSILRCAVVAAVSLAVQATPALAEEAAEGGMQDAAVAQEAVRQEAGEHEDEHATAAVSGTETPALGEAATDDAAAVPGEDTEGQDLATVDDAQAGEDGNAPADPDVAAEGDEAAGEDPTPALPEEDPSDLEVSSPASVTPAKGELNPSEYDAAKLLDDGGVYSFGPGGKTVVVSDVSGDARLADRSNYLSGYWRVQNLGGGTYSFSNLDSGKSLSYGTDEKLPSNVGLGGALTNWLVLKRNDGTFSLAPETLGHLRLDIYLGKLVAGSNVDLWRANGSEAQRFVFSKHAAMTEAAATGKTIADEVVSITCSDAGAQSVDVKGGSAANGANVQIYRSNGSLAQRYKLAYKGNGLYTIQVLKSGRYLDVANGGTKPGSNVRQWNGNDSLAQHWYFKKSGSAYVICNAKSGLALDRYLARSANGTNVHIWTRNSSKAQAFAVRPDKVLAEAMTSGQAVKDGIYAIGASVGSKMVIDIAGGKTTNGANAQLYSSNGSRAQKFELTYMGCGLYTIQAGHSGKYLTVANATKGANVSQLANNASRNQMWYLVKSGSGYVVKSSLSGMVLDLANGKSAKGTNVRAWTANGSAAQRFSLSQTPLLGNGTYVLSSMLSPAQLVEVQGASTGNGANVQVHRMRRSTGQQWVLTYVGNGAYKIANKNSGLVLDVASGSVANGANVRQWRSNGSDAQKWEFGVGDDGSISIRNAKSGKYLDLKGGKSASGTNVQQYRGNGSAAQSFVAYAVSSNFVKSGKTGYQNPSQYYQISAYDCSLPSYAKGRFTYVTPSRISPTASRAECVETFIKRAYEYMGTAYVWDWAMAPGEGVDCAGLVMQCLYAVGMQTPYNTYDHVYDPWQDHNAENMRADSKFKQVSFSERQRGDLIFYAGHVGIYLGNNQIINAYPPNVQIQSVYSWTPTGCSRVFV